MEVLDNNQSSAVLTDQTIAHMKASSPWMTFLAVMAIISGSFMALAGIFGMMASPLIGLIYLVVAGVYIYCGTLILGMGKNMKVYAQDRSPASMELFFKNHKIMSIISGVIIILYILVIIGFVIFAFNSRSFIR